MVCQKKKCRVLVTAGPTRAYLDEVRFLSNYSTGAVGYEICKALIKKRVEVGLVSGPTVQRFNALELRCRESVMTNEQMLRAVLRQCREFRPQFVIFSAAVLDFVPNQKQSGKVSSRRRTWQLKLKRAPKIIDEVARRFPKIRRMGFKLEWEQNGNVPEELAKRYLRKKGLETLCLNYLSKMTSPKRHPAILVAKDGRVEKVQTKRGIANWMSDYVVDAF